MDISKPAPMFTGSGALYFSVASTMASAQSSTYRNSRVALPVPQTGISLAPVFTASTHFFIRAGITWEEPGLKLSPGP